MVDAIKKEKAKALRYTHAIVRDLNLDTISSNLYEMQESCENARWSLLEMRDDELSAVLEESDDEEIEEFKTAFLVLEADCERLISNMQDMDIPKCFDDLFCTVGGSESGGGLLGYDSYEGDFFGLDCFEENLAREESQKRLERMPKRDLIYATTKCFQLCMAYVGLKSRYDYLKASMDVLAGNKAGILKAVRQVNEIYDKLAEMETNDSAVESEKVAMRHKFEIFAATLPDSAWVR